MKFALDTYRDVAQGTRDRKIHALFTFALWFAAGGYLFATLGEYFVPLASDTANFLGALAVSTVVSAIKFS